MQLATKKQTSQQLDLERPGEVLDLQPFSTSQYRHHVEARLQPLTALAVEIPLSGSHDLPLFAWANRFGWSTELHSTAGFAPD